MSRPPSRHSPRLEIKFASSVSSTSARKPVQHETIYLAWILLVRLNAAAEGRWCACGNIRAIVDMSCFPALQMALS